MIVCSRRGVGFVRRTRQPQEKGRAKSYNLLLPSRLQSKSDTVRISDVILPMGEGQNFPERPIAALLFGISPLYSGWAGHAAHAFTASSTTRIRPQSLRRRQYLAPSQDKNPISMFLWQQLVKVVIPQRQSSAITELDRW